MGPIGEKAIGIGMNLGSNMLGGLFQRGSNKKNMKRQYEYQQKLNKQGHDLQFDMWNKTNYPAQLEMMKKAGLNPGLMYGLGGGGGTTTGSQGGGSAAGGQAPMMDMGVDPTTLAQIDNIKANTEKTIAEKNKIEGVDTDKTGAEARAVNASAYLDEALGNAMKDNEGKYIKGLLDEWANKGEELDANKKLNVIKQMEINMKKNGFYNETFATTFGILFGMDPQKENVMDNKVSVLPKTTVYFLHNTLGVPLDKLPTMTNRQVIQVMAGAYVSGKILGNVVDKGIDLLGIAANAAKQLAK